MRDVHRDDILGMARAWIGTPYIHQASLRGIGCDCLGLVRGIWRDLYGDEPEPVPPYTPDWAEARSDEILAEAAHRHFVEVPGREARPGDLLLFRWRTGLPAKHAGILSGDDRMIHAHDGARVSEVPLGLWRRRMSHCFRFPGVSD